MQITVINNKEDLIHENENWRELAAKIRDPFADMCIYLNWSELFLGKRALYVLKVADKDSVIAYAPFYCAGRNIGWLGEGRVNYLDLICDEGDKRKVWDAVLAHLKVNKFSRIKLANLNSFSSSSTIIGEKNFRLIKKQVCPYLKIDPAKPWTDFYNSVLKNKRRYEVRKGLEKLEQSGSFKIINKEQQDITDEDIAKIFELYKRRWSNTYREKLISDKYFIYQKNLIKNCSNMFLSQAYLDDKLISFILGFKKNKNFTDYIVAHDPDLAAYSLGAVHLSKLIEAFHNEGITLFDFSLGDEVYKRKWAKEETHNYDYLSSGYLEYLLIIAVNNIKKYLAERLKKKR